MLIKSALEGFSIPKARREETVANQISKATPGPGAHNLPLYKTGIAKSFAHHPSGPSKPERTDDDF